MKILIVASRYYPNVLGGGEISTQILAEALAGKGHKTVVVSLNPEGHRVIAEVNGVRVYYLPLRNIYPIRIGGKQRPAVARAVWHALDSYNPFMSSSLGSILEVEHPDVVNTHSIDGFSASVWRAAKKCRLPLVHTIRSLYVLCPQANMYRKGNNCAKPCTLCRIYSRPRRRLSSLVDVAMGISRFVLEAHIRQACFPWAEKVVVYNACEMAPEADLSAQSSNGAVRFGYLGRLHPTKGVEVLIRSFLELPGGKAKLLIAGRGASHYEDLLRRLINGHPAVSMLGFVPPSDFLSKVDVLVVPSLCQEAAGRVVLESMAHHVPVLGSCRGGIPEQLGEGTGWIFDPDEPGALTRTMQRAINSRDELEVIGERAGDRARQFSTEAMVNGYLKAFSCAIDRNNKNTERR